MIKICQECGQEFEATNGMQKFCNRQHMRNCVICGQPFPITKYHLTATDAKTTCSKKCSAKLRKQTNIKKYGGVAPASSAEVQAKMKATNLERYGVEHGAQSEQAKLKTIETNQQRYGVDHYSQSAESREHMHKLWQDDEYRTEVREKITATNLEKYGSECVWGNKEIRQKCNDTYYAKTGHRQPLDDPAVRNKIRSTNQQKYGVDAPLQNKDILHKSEQTNLDRYGYINPMQNINIQRKAQATCLERYGNTCYLQSDIGRMQTASAMESRYNKHWYSQTADWKYMRMTDPAKLSNLVEFDTDPKSYILSHFDVKPTLRELSDSIGTGTEAASLRVNRANCTDLVAYVYSYMENEVYNAIHSIHPEIVVERNTHKVITPQELDIFLPEYNIGIECNPTSTHNSSINTFDSSASPTAPGYHLMKTEKCEDRGIFLFHIFGSEWTYSRDIIISMLRNLLGKCDRKIYARNCEIREVAWSEAEKFLNMNHRQGSANSPIRLGLYYENKLVSLMTFGKMRASIGTSSKEDLSNCWELVRFCSELNTVVVGGASKLFKYFIDKYSPEEVRSFSDRAHTRGNLYEKLGFIKVRTSNPGYVWVDLRTDISYHRFCSQKQNIAKFLHDPDVDLSKTERQIMIEHEFVQMYDCGTILWKWVKNP